MQPEEIARFEHRDYYDGGSFSYDRLRWTIETFLSTCHGKRVLEVGCGDGRLLSLLQENNEVFGIDVSTGGVDKCSASGIPAICMDVSSESLPFPDDHFDFVITLETLEHLMNPYYALLEIRRVLKENAKLVCSVPNPATGHPYLYPGLFEFRNFVQFLKQLGWRIDRVEPWQWAPREAILPAPLRRSSLASSRYVAGAFRRVIEKASHMMGKFPSFCYWLWTFECSNVEKSYPNILARQAQMTKPKAKVPDP